MSDTQGVTQNEYIFNYLCVIVTAKNYCITIVITSILRIGGSFYRKKWCQERDSNPRPPAYEDSTY